MMVGFVVARGSGKDGVGGIVQLGVAVAVTMSWVYSHAVKNARTVFVVVVVTGEGVIVA